MSEAQNSETIPCFILAGGKSSRFGRDKARAILDGKSLLEIVANSLRPFASSITVVADIPDKYSDLGFHTLADLRTESGPLAGVEAALAHNQDTDWILCTSCDLIGLKETWIRQLLDARQDQYSAVAFRSKRWQSFPLLVRPNLLETVREFLDQDQRTLWRFIETSNPAEISLPKDWEESKNINDIKDL